MRRCVWPMDTELFDELLAQRAAASAYAPKKSESLPDGVYSRRWQVNW